MHLQGRRRSDILRGLAAAAVDPEKAADEIHHYDDAHFAVYLTVNIEEAVRRGWITRRMADQFLKLVKHGMPPSVLALLLGTFGP